MSFAPFVLAHVCKDKRLQKDDARMRMMERTEKRKHKRLGAKFDISCRKVGSTEERAYVGRTVNVSSGGVYFETTTETFKLDNLLKIELSIPPTSGLLEFGGKIAGFAKVLRTENICDSAAGKDSSSDRYGVALQFCRPPKLCI
jgi:hypothetical protein